MSLENEVALVTGSSRGIGQAIALELGKQGATIVGTATTDNGAEKISAWMKENDIKGVGKKLNVTDNQGVVDLISDMKKEFALPGILVNNAGITRDNLLMRMKDDEWDDVINTNLNAIFRLSKACLRGMMKARKGRIISIASVVGSMGNPGQANYAAAKAGLLGFSKSLAREVGSRGITVNVVAPGFIETDMTKALTEDQRSMMQENIPLARFGEANEIAKVCAFLASDGAGYITGETIHVNGGMYMN
ncbi:MAG: 3-oxoacyl-ACP reductase FabG [Methylococcales bacterium]|nr:3-oxoacyl-ACP reductase FabG [Methylococcales bacterium]MBT7410036.1 3-oxoacyl-ACP reductase FabG [Methylococcales bacterium]